MIVAIEPSGRQGDSRCREVPLVSVYQSNLCGSGLSSRDVASLLNDSHFISSFSLEFATNSGKEMQI